MNGIGLLAIAAGVFLAGYFLYARLLERMLGVNPSRKTPARERRDGIDFVPAHPAVLFGHHFATIAGAGPIVGPILAAEFGWGAVALWIILGCVFIGAAHDMISLFLSIRHRGESIGSVIGTILGRPGKILFLLFSWSALILVVAEFTRQIVGTFLADPGIATASLLFIAEAVAFGLCVNKFNMPVLWASLVFVPIMFASVWIGSLFPLDIVARCGLTKEMASLVWTSLILVYCFLASTCPVWILLQPRDYLNSYLLYAMMALGFIGVIVANPSLQMPAFAGFSAIKPTGATDMLFPFLFVTVACGACSGFHALVASGTTAKQLDSEKSTRTIAYGGMLVEGVLAIIALIGVAGTYSDVSMYFKDLMPDGLHAQPVPLFASTLAGFCVNVFSAVGIPAETGVQIAKSFILLSVAAFLMTTVDSGTRLARFSWQELVGCVAKPGTRVAKTASNMYLGSLLVCVLVGGLLVNKEASAQLWTIFASANQLLAALTLLSATLWFVRNNKPCWFTAIPTCLMFAVSSWALCAIFKQSVTGGNLDFVRMGASGFLLLLAAILVGYAVVFFRNSSKSRCSQ